MSNGLFRSVLLSESYRLPILDMTWLDRKIFNLVLKWIQHRRVIFVFILCIKWAWLVLSRDCLYENKKFLLVLYQNTRKKFFFFCTYERDRRDDDFWTQNTLKLNYSFLKIIYQNKLFLIHFILNNFMSTDGGKRNVW